MNAILALIDFILHIGDHLQTLVHNHGKWIYAILFAIVFCETGLRWGEANRASAP